MSASDEVDGAQFAFIKSSQNSLCEKVRSKQRLEGEDGMRRQSSGVRGRVRKRVLGCENS